MRTIFKILFLLFVLFPGCTEVIDFAGILVNRLNIQDPNPKEIIVSVKNIDSSLIPGFEVTLKENYSSKCIASPKFTNSLIPVRFNLPDEQVESIPENSPGITVVIFHPEIGKFLQEIPDSKLRAEEQFDIMFWLPVNTGNLTKQPISKYPGCD